MSTCKSSFLLLVSAKSSPLSFKENGEFKILQVADMHYADNKSTTCEDVLASEFPTCSDLNTTAFINREYYKSSPPAQSEGAPGLEYFHIPLPEVNDLNNSSITGIKQESIGCPLYNSRFVETMVEAGDVKAAFTGHDHLNDFCGKVKGIELCYAGGFGYQAYGKAGGQGEAESGGCISGERQQWRMERCQIYNHLEAFR